MRKALPWLLLALIALAVAASVAWRFRGEDTSVFDTKSVRMEVMNGSGVPRVGRAVADELQMRGYDVYGVVGSSRHYRNTVVVDLRDPRGANARDVARSLRFQRRWGRIPLGRPIRPAVGVAIDSSRYLEVRVVVGDDYHLFFPTVTPLH